MKISLRLVTLRIAVVFIAIFSVEGISWIFERAGLDSRGFKFYVRHIDNDL